jgi:hypothetical protein
MLGESPKVLRKSRVLALFVLLLVATAAFLGRHPKDDPQNHSPGMGERPVEGASPPCRSTATDSSPADLEEARRRIIAAAIDEVVRYYKARHVDELLGWSEEDARDPGKWGLGYGAFPLSLRGPGGRLQDLASGLATEVWRDTDSFAAFVEILRQRGDPDTTRIAIWYGGGPFASGAPDSLSNATLQFGRKLIGDLCDEKNPMLRLLMMRAMNYVGRFPYTREDLARLTGLVATETVSGNIQPLMAVLSAHSGRIHEVREFLIVQALGEHRSGLDRQRQLSAAHFLCQNPMGREDPAVFTAVITLLRRSDDPELQDRALDFLRRIPGADRKLPDLSDNNPTSVTYFNELLKAYGEAGTAASQSPQVDRIRRKMIDKIGTFDMPQAASFLESVLRDPKESMEVKADVLENVSLSSFYGGEKRYLHASGSFVRMLTHVSGDLRLDGKLRTDAYSKLIAFHRSMDKKDAGEASRDIQSLIDRMLADPDPQVKEAGARQLDRAKTPDASK